MPGFNKNIITYKVKQNVRTIMYNILQVRLAKLQRGTSTIEPIKPIKIIPIMETHQCGPMPN